MVGEANEGRGGDRREGRGKRARYRDAKGQGKERTWGLIENTYHNRLRRRHVSPLPIKGDAEGGNGGDERGREDSNETHGGPSYFFSLVLVLLVGCERRKMVLGLKLGELRSRGKVGDVRAGSAREGTIDGGRKGMGMGNGNWGRCFNYVICK